MSFIAPVSGLSIRRAVNLYTIILLLSFGGLLYWLAADRYRVFINAHYDTASNTTKVVAFQINQLLLEKQRIIDMFVDNNKNLITELSKNMDDDELHQRISARLKKYLPDFFEFNISTVTSKYITGDTDNSILNERLDNIRHYILNNEQHMDSHASLKEHHYNIISKYTINHTSQIFFVSFNVNEISELLKSTQPANHKLLLVNKEANNLIEVTSQVDESTIDSKLNFRVSGNDYLRALSSIKVKDTRWHLLDIHDKNLFSDYLNKIVTEFFIVFYIFALITLFMRHILLNQDTKRTAAEEQLLENNNQIKDLNNQLEQLSRTDSLTCLYNRRYFDEIIYLEWNRGLRSKNTLSCILLDIDYFKNYNDLYGHQAGDKCLKDIALIMQDTFRRAGDVVARYGGEEFIVIMSDTDEHGATSAMKLFQEELAKLKIPHQDSKTSDYVTVSAGIVSQVPSQENSIEDFIRKADKAMYQAKTAGKNQWVIYQG